MTLDEDAWGGMMGCEVLGGRFGAFGALALVSLKGSATGLRTTLSGSGGGCAMFVASEGGFASTWRSLRMSKTRGDFFSEDHCTTVSSDLEAWVGSKEAGAGFFGLLGEGGLLDDSTSTVVVRVMFIVGAGGRDVLADQSTTVSFEPSNKCEVGDRTVPLGFSLLEEASRSGSAEFGLISTHGPA